MPLTRPVIDAWNGPFDDSNWTPSSVDFMLFTSVWTLLAVAYLAVTPTHFPNFAHKYLILAVEAVTMIFWFAAWVAVASLWGDISCGSRGGPCGAGTAAIVFGAFIWCGTLCRTACSD